MTQLSKADACALLHISESTMTRRLKAGRYKATKQGDGKFAPLVFTYAGIGLTEPVAEVESSDKLSEHPEPEPSGKLPERPEPGASSPRLPDLSTPDAFNPHEYRDSFGHSLTGNADHKMFESQPPARKGAWSRSADRFENGAKPTRTPEQQERMVKQMHRRGEGGLPTGDMLLGRIATFGSGTDVFQNRVLEPMHTA